MSSPESKATESSVLILEKSRVGMADARELLKTVEAFLAEEGPPQDEPKEEEALGDEDQKKDRFETRLFKGRRQSGASIPKASRLSDATVRHERRRSSSTTARRTSRPVA